MSADQSAGRIQGAQDEGAVAANEYPVLIAGVDNAGLISTLFINGGSLDVTVTGPVVTISQSNTGSWTDRSGTIALANTSQQLAPANVSRTYLLIENVGTDVLWVNFGVAAVKAQPSLRLEVGAGLVLNRNDFCDIDQVNVISATAGTAYTAKEA